jgi:hypothetical protein
LCRLNYCQDFYRHDEAGEFFRAIHAEAVKNIYLSQRKFPKSPWGDASPFMEIRNFGKYCGKAFRVRRRGRDALADGTSAPMAFV